MRYLRFKFLSLQDVIVRPLIYREVRRLESLKNPVADSLASIIRETFSGALTKQEKVTLTLIEEKRKELIASDRAVTITDFGAGAKNGSEEKQKIIGEVAVAASKTPRWALLLFKIIRAYKPECCVELGTCLGVSGMYEASALKVNGSGKLITMEGAEAYAAIAKQNFHSLSLTNVEIVVGQFQKTLQEVLQKTKSIGYAFIDGHHDGDATLRYFETLFPKLEPNTVVIFDDIHWSAGMKEAWRNIQRDSRISVAADLFQVGVVILK